MGLTDALAMPESLDAMGNRDTDELIADDLKRRVKTCSREELTEQFLWRHGPRYLHQIAENPHWPGALYHMPEEVMRACVTEHPEYLEPKHLNYWKLDRLVMSMVTTGCLPRGHEAIDKIAIHRYKSTESNGFHQFQKVAGYCTAEFVKREWPNTTEKSRAWFLAIPSIPEEYKYKSLQYYFRRNLDYEVATPLHWDKLKKVSGKYFGGFRHFLRSNKLEGTPWTVERLKTHCFGAIVKALAGSRTREDIEETIKYYTRRYEGEL